MFRYISLVWDDSSHVQRDAVQLVAHRLHAVAPQWRQAFSNEGLRIFCADTDPGRMQSHVLAGNCGAVLGTIFERRSDIEDDTPSRAIDFHPGRHAAAERPAGTARSVLWPRAGEAIRKSRGRWLIERCWGNYVAFVPDAHSATVWVIKDPTGSLPCFSTRFRGVTIFFSCLADCIRLDLFRFTLDPSWLASRVAGSGGTTQRGPLGEVWQVHRGECVGISPCDPMPVASRQFYWQPTRFAGADDPIEDSDRAARAVRATVRASVHSWAGGHASLLHRLSGGLDSSIIIACLSDAPAHSRITCYTYYNPGGRLDERTWARLAASASGCELTEYALTPADIDLRAALHMQPSVEPVPAMGYLQRITLEQPLAESSGASAVFCGDGGDSGFCSDSIAHVVPDFLRRHGFRARVFRLASQVAVCSGQSTWTVLSRALRAKPTPTTIRKQRERLLSASRLVSREVLDSIAQDGCAAHPWFSGPEHTHPTAMRGPGTGMPAIQRRRDAAWISSATARRMGALLCTPDFYTGCEPEASMPEIIAPLYSQPVIELLLRIPLYRHFDGGCDRGLARRAFAADVPQPILRRQWKDRAPGFYEELVDRNRLLLRELLLDGVLVEERLLDRSAIEAALSGRFSKGSVFPGELFRHLDVELWARQWAQGRQPISGGDFNPTPASEAPGELEIAKALPEIALR